MTQLNALADEFYRQPSEKFIKSAIPPAFDMDQPQEEDMGVEGYIFDALKGIPRGVLGAASDVADLATMPFDYDVPDYFGLMEPSKTFIGGLTEGVSNFMTGFIPGVKVAGALGKVGKIGQLTKYVDDAIEVADMAKNTKKALALRGTQAFVKGSVGGAIADFGTFDGHEARLSNLLREHAGFTDPVTAYLAADEGDGEIEGRLKNAIEGLAIGGLTEGLFTAFRLYKAGYFAKGRGIDPNEAMAAEAIKIRGEQRTLLKQAFNLTDEEAEATNILIDRMGLDRSRLKIAVGTDAQAAYDAAAGTALEQRRAGVDGWDKVDTGVTDGRMNVGTLVETFKTVNGKAPETVKDYLVALGDSQDPLAPLAKAMLEKVDVTTLGAKIESAPKIGGRGRMKERAHARMVGWEDATPYSRLRYDDSTVTLIHEIAHQATMAKVVEAVNVYSGSLNANYRNVLNSNRNKTGSAYLKALALASDDAKIDQNVRSLMKAYLRVAQDSRFADKLSKGNLVVSEFGSWIAEVSDAPPATGSRAFDPSLYDFGQIFVPSGEYITKTWSKSGNVREAISATAYEALRVRRMELPKSDLLAKVAQAQKELDDFMSARGFTADSVPAAYRDNVDRMTKQVKYLTARSETAADGEIWVVRYDGVGIMRDRRRTSWGQGGFRRISSNKSNITPNSKWDWSGDSRFESGLKDEFKPLALRNLSQEELAAIGSKHNIDFTASSADPQWSIQFNSREEAMEFAQKVSGTSFGQGKFKRIGGGAAGRPDTAVERGLPYGLGNIDEFIAETISNPKFQNLLREFKIDENSSENLLTTFLNAIKSILNISDDQAKTLLDRVLSDVETLSGASRAELAAQRNAAIGGPKALFDQPWRNPKANLIKDQFAAKAGAPVLRQDIDSEVRGFAAFADDGNAIIGGLSNPNVSTAIEEITHVARRQLFDKGIPENVRYGISDADIDTAAKWAGADDINGEWDWSVQAEERFAAGFQRYLREGTAPAGLEGLFSKLASWLTNLYREVKGSPIDIPVSKEMEEVFGKLVSRGPGFDSASAMAGAGAALLRSTTPSPGSSGLGKPPEKELNLERFSSVDEVNRLIDEQIKSQPLASTLPEDEQSLSSVVTRAQTAADELRSIAGMESLDLQRMLNTNTTSRWQIEKATTELQGMRKFAANAGNRLVELAKKGKGASTAETYEFLVGERSLTVVLQTIKERSREVARSLGAMRIVPTPDKTFSFLPPMPKPGEAVSPGATVPPPGSAVPSPGSIPTEPARVPTEAPGGTPASAVPGTRPEAPEVPEGGSVPTPEVPGTAITPGMDEAARLEVMRRVIEQAGGEDAVRASMERYLAAAAGGGDEAVLRMARGQQQWSAALVEFWMNNILSGPITHAVNNSANLITTLYLPFERMLGATVRGDMKTAGIAMRRYLYLYQQAFDSVKMAGVALKLDSNVLDTVATRETGNSRAISATGLGVAEDSVFGQAANWVGKALNLPTRFLTAEDEFFKQLNYRAAFMSELHVEGLRRFPKDAQQAARWTNETFNRALQEGQMYARDVILKRAYSEADKAIENGTIAASERMMFVSRFMNNQKNWDSRLGVMSQRSMDAARQATFSTPLTTDPSAPITTRLAARLQAAANEHPAIRFILPFIRTPTNLLNFTIERSIPAQVPNLRTAYRDYGKELSHVDANIRADAAGRLAFSLSVSSVISIAALNGTITGGGPKNKGERETLMQAGWQPYSVKVGDKYYSYKREDPFASIIGLVADAVEGLKYATDREMDAVDGLVHSIVLSIARNITNKTYLTGITNVTNAISNPEQFGPTLVNQYVSSLVPFSAALDQSKSTLADDPVLRDVRTMADAIYSKIPFLAEEVAPQRNVLGEVMKKPAALGPDMFSPIMYTQVTDDLILQEFGILGHGFTPPKATRGAIDLTQFSTGDGQGAYDRWLELHGIVKIGGQNLKQALVKTIKSKDYQILSPDTTDDYDSPRVRVIRGIISKYRAAAYKQLLKESPDLRQADRLDFANKQALRMGRSAQELFDLGNR